ncbi:uncharacterized protein LOC132203644 isoform X2 [Neocloeon triangulifer]|uniref:uncharacterized protein LOC132203644 isoform X2 n=1 Tax=Neocloeon triangulifer TaxID=2078957 RepID=UPI00286F5BC7|nr:uncharacterized protein LOC132203644 isoform X2 [Neocloeon triangulifer]
MKWLLMTVIMAGTTSAQMKNNIFFPGGSSSTLVSNPQNAQNSAPSIQNISKRIAAHLTSTTARPNEERRYFESSRSNEFTTISPISESRTFGFPQTQQFTTPSPLSSNNNLFFNSQPQFFSSLNRPGIFGNSPFGLNDFNFQSQSSFPSFNSGPDLSIFNSGANGGQPKNYHYRRDFNDKDGYSPWRDVSGSKQPTNDQGGFQQPSSEEHLTNFPGPNFHQKFDLGPDGFFNFEKQNNVDNNNGYSGKTQAIMKIEPGSGRGAAEKQINNKLFGNTQTNRLGNSNDNGIANWAQSFRNVKWPGQN